MKVLAVTPYYLPEGGGLERYAHEILARLAERGHEVHALAFTADRARSEIREGVRVERVEPLARLGNTPVDPTFPLSVERRIRREEPDVVVAHTPVPFAAEAAALAATRHGMPFVVTYHAGTLRGGSALLDGLAAAHRWTAQRWMLARAERLVAVSPHVRDGVLADHRERTSVIPPGVDQERFSPGTEPRGDRVLFVGPLDEAYRWKGIDVLLAALPRVRDSCPDVEAELVGDGDRFGEIAERADAAPVPIHLEGRVGDGKLVDAYRRAGVTVLPSTSDAESFGMVLAEANACGCPVVASDVGGISSFVEHGSNGLLARPGDPEDLAAKITQLLAEPHRARRMGQRGREIVREEHDWADLAARTEALLQAAADGGAPSPPPQAPTFPPPRRGPPRPREGRT